MSLLTSAYGSDVLKTWKVEGPDSCAAGHCSAFGEGHLEWGFGKSARAIKAQPLACTPSAATESWYEPCQGAENGGATVCAARTLEMWDDATIADSETINFVDQNFYAGPPSMLWNTNWAPMGLGDVDLGHDGEPKCYPVSHMSGRRSKRIVWGSDFVPQS